MIPTFQQQVRLRPGSRVAAIMMVIEHPDGEVVGLHPADISGLEFETETSVDFNTGQVSQSGRVAFSFANLVVADLDPDLVTPVAPQQPAKKCYTCPTCGFDPEAEPHTHCMSPDCPMFPNSDFYLY